MESNAAESAQSGQLHTRTQQNLPEHVSTPSSLSEATTSSQLNALQPAQEGTITRPDTDSGSGAQDTAVVPTIPHTLHSHKYMLADISTHKIAAFMSTKFPHFFTRSTTSHADEDTLRLPIHSTTPLPPLPAPAQVSPVTTIIVMALLCVLVFSALTNGATRFVGAQGWSYTLNGPLITKKPNLLKSHATAQQPLTPQAYINSIVARMSLQQKLGQMMMVQFTGSTDSNQIETMITQQDVGAVLLSPANGNILNAAQLTTLTHSLQSSSQTYNSALPLAIATDQEGGAVDRLLPLDGASPAARTIGETSNTTKARQQGILDAQHFSAYGLNLNLAPVVDVDTQPASELHQDLRTFSGNPATVSAMALAYLQGLQQSGKIVGTLKHFPGLGSVTADPHVTLPILNRSLQQIEQQDWAPYNTLIPTGQVHAIMVTHELVPALDPNEPASLSTRIIQQVLRNQMHFQGVIMTDSVTMQSLDAYDNGDPDQAAVLSIKAGSDMIIGASSPQEVATIFNDLEEAINAGSIPQTQIDASVQRVLMMKYAMGLLPLPNE